MKIQFINSIGSKYIKNVFNLIKPLFFISLSCIFALYFVGCATNKSPNQNIDDNAQKNNQINTKSGIVQNAKGDSLDSNSNNTEILNDNKAERMNSVHFGFDQYNVGDDAQEIIDLNSGYLANNKEAKVKIEGNTDDTGSVEYNLALGQRRADAVRKALIAAGANGNQIETVSNGKLKNVFPNDTEENKQQNRRADIYYSNNNLQIEGYSVAEENKIPYINK